MLLNLVDSNLQTGDDPLVPYTEISGDDGLLEYRFRYPISLSDIKIDLQSIFNDPDFSEYTIGIYYRLDENENNPKQVIRLEDISNDSYDYVNGFTDITGLVSENNGYVELKTKLKIGCKVFGVIVEKIV